MDQFFRKYGIAQVTIPLPFRLNHIHCYLTRQNDQDWTIIDTGLHRQETVDTWKKAFTQYGLKERDLKKIIVTHYHPDHFGYAGELQRETTADVLMGKKAYQLGKKNWTKENQKQSGQFYCQAGMEEKTVKELVEHDGGFFSMVRPFPEVTHFLQEGQQIQIGELTFRALHTPGHEEGHFCFYQPDEKLLFSGDHLLKKITPNISYLGLGDDNPLGTYLSSLEKLGELEINWVLPGHGPIFSDARERIDEIIQHHKERIIETYETIKREMTAFQISKLLFQRELTIHEERFALGETISHLAYLLAKGEIKKTPDSQGVWHYTRS